MSDLDQCQQRLIDAGKAYPRTCGVCGLGPCREAQQFGHAEALDRLAEWFDGKGQQPCAAACRAERDAQRKLARIASACGNPDPAEACRTILGICKEGA